MDLSAFFAASAGAAAALMGLLFVALQFNLEKRHSDLSWQPVARATFNIYTLVFSISLFGLIQFAPTYNAQRLIFLIAPAVAIFRQVRIWLPVWHQLKTNRLLHTFWLMIAPVMLYGLMILYALQPPANPPNPLDIEIPEATLIAVLFLAALRNSWDLVLEAGLVQPAP